MIVAKKFAAPGKRKVHFAVSDAADFSAELKDMNVSDVNDAPVVMARDMNERRYVMQHPLTYVMMSSHMPVLSLQFCSIFWRMIFL